MSAQSPAHRPIGVTILAGLAALAAILAAVHMLQFVGIIPFFIGEVAVRGFNIWYAIMWGLMVWVYVWLVQMLWQVNPSAWLFLVVITIFNLTLDFVALIGSTTVSDISASLIVNAIILGYCMLPGVRGAFMQR